MSVRTEKTKEGMDLIIDGFEKGIASSPYSGIGNIRNLNTSYMPGVAYVNYRRQATTFNTSNSTLWFAGTHSVNVSNNHGWTFSAPFTPTMTNPVQHATSPAGINYILDDLGQIWKQSAANSSTFNYLAGGSGRIDSGAGGLAYWNGYLVVIGNGLVEYCGNGTDDSGVISSNWNVQGTPSQVTITSAVLSMNPVSSIPYSYVWTGTVTTGSTSATLNSNWTGLTGSYFVRFTNAAVDTRTVTFTNGSTTTTWTGGLTNDATTQFLMYQFTASSGTFIGTNSFSSGLQVTFSSSGTLPTGIVAGTKYYLRQTIDLSGSTVFNFSTTSATGQFVPLTDAGTGTITISLLPSTAPPIVNTTTTFSYSSWGTPGIGSTTLILPSVWLQASGIWNLVDPLGNALLGTFTYLSQTITLLNPAVIQSSGTFQINFVNPTSTSNRIWISKVDGNLYFANGRWVARISSSPNTNMKFNPGIPASYSVNYSVTGTLKPDDTVVDMVDLQRTLMIAGNKDIYPWDYVSAQPSSSFPVDEQIYKLINILNNIYIIAGTKGNIYVSNGSSAQILIKIPDYIAGVIDPIWSWGGMMVHRSKLWVQALAQNSSGTNILAGIFSLLVSPGLLVEQSSGLVMESQNSYGLTPASGAKANALLIDNETWSSGVDSYYSAWSNGASVGGIDYNDGTPWQGGEPIIETDIIPIGNYLVKKTLGSIEFKLDRPLATGDSIALYWRPSLTNSYTQIPLVDTSANLLSNYAGTAINQAQWAQFKVVFTAASSSTSFLPIRELRLHING
jgi:hypothetical protein